MRTLLPVAALVSGLAVSACSTAPSEPTRVRTEQPLLATVASAAAGFKQTFSTTKFQTGPNVANVLEPGGMTKWVGANGVFSIDDIGTGGRHERGRRLHSIRRRARRPRGARSELLPLGRPSRRSRLGRCTRTSTPAAAVPPEPRSPTEISWTVRLSRGHPGYPRRRVACLGARLDVNGNVVAEGVYWPPISAGSIADALAMKSVLASPAAAALLHGEAAGLAGRGESGHPRDSPLVAVHSRCLPRRGVLRRMGEHEGPERYDRARAVLDPSLRQRRGRGEAAPGVARSSGECKAVSRALDVARVLGAMFVCTVAVSSACSSGSLPADAVACPTGDMVLQSDSAERQALLGRIVHLRRRRHVRGRHERQHRRRVDVAIATEGTGTARSYPGGGSLPADVRALLLVRAELRCIPRLPPVLSFWCSLLCCVWLVHRLLLQLRAHGFSVHLRLRQPVRPRGVLVPLHALFAMHPGQQVRERMHGPAPTRDDSPRRVRRRRVGRRRRRMNRCDLA